jgi:hypothetical protein
VITTVGKNEKASPTKSPGGDYPASISKMAGAANLIDPFLSDSPSWHKGWSGYIGGKNSTQGGDR